MEKRRKKKWEEIIKRDVFKTNWGGTTIQKESH